ncbi:aa3-type cytochrome c oxidase subunit IV [Sphingomonas sp. R-74633]|nr:aa3-type cytochrome c oxidase subunit IV [Sphingomonas sp. R-74633]NYT42438.1 aa3-type cytochrome c oxidase subunit IV [Sphingomonas sp. R-74633]
MADGFDSADQVKAHEQTWTGFKAMMMWGTVGAALVAALVVFLISAK